MPRVLSKRRFGGILAVGSSNAPKGNRMDWPGFAGTRKITNSSTGGETTGADPHRLKGVLRFYRSGHPGFRSAEHLLQNRSSTPGRVPHVRQSVRGPKNTGAAPTTASLLYRENESVIHLLLKRKWWAASVFFIPCTLWRTWGTRPMGEVQWRSLDTFDEHGLNRYRFVRLVL
jgi:hypothetical protein